MNDLYFYNQGETYLQTITAKYIRSAKSFQNVKGKLANYKNKMGTGERKNQKFKKTLVCPKISDFTTTWFFGCRLDF